MILTRCGRRLLKVPSEAALLAYRECRLGLTDEQVF